jgi:disulfide bond formation protein DsbB
VRLRSLLFNPKFAPAAVLGASLAVLASVFAFQYWGGLQPCVLCVYQRYPYGIAIALSLTALALARRPEGAGVSRRFVQTCALVFAAGFAIALFHVGVEQHWWQGTPECGATSTAATLQELEEMLKHGPVVRCDQPQWSLFGITMAGYNVLISAALAVFCVLAPKRANS